MEKKLILVRGISGSGKTTLSDVFANALGGKAFAADDFFMVGKEYKWDSSKLGDAHEWCRNSVINEIENGSGIAIVHNTLTTESQVAEYVEIAKRTGAKLISIIVEKRHEGKNLHGVSDKKLRKQSEQLKQSIKLY